MAGLTKLPRRATSTNSESSSMVWKTALSQQKSQSVKRVLPCHTGNFDKAKNKQNGRLHHCLRQRQLLNPLGLLHEIAAFLSATVLVKHNSPNSPHVAATTTNCKGFDGGHLQHIAAAWFHARFVCPSCSQDLNRRPNKTAERPQNKKLETAWAPAASAGCSSSPVSCSLS